jgi:hypothetical protein
MFLFERGGLYLYVEIRRICVVKNIANHVIHCIVLRLSRDFGLSDIGGMIRFANRWRIGQPSGNHLIHMAFTTDRASMLSLFAVEVLRSGWQWVGGSSWRSCFFSWCRSQRLARRG